MRQPMNQDENAVHQHMQEDIRISGIMLDTEREFPDIMEKFHNIIISNKTVGHTGIASLMLPIGGKSDETHKRSLSGWNMSPDRC